MAGGQVIMGNGWLALSGWVACVMTVVLQVAYYNRFFGRIEADLATTMKATDKAHSRLDFLQEQVHPQLRPCKELIELQNMIMSNLGAINANVSNLTKAVDKLQEQVEKKDG